jgi:multimeric flavodoxin WrbA
MEMAIVVAYWSGTGNTAKGAELVADGIREAGKEAQVVNVEEFAAGKKIGLFGSYGWGDGEWMRDWVKRMEDAGAAVYGGESAIFMNEPDGAEDELKGLGRELAAL